jgi:hypothetical protein
VAVNFDRTKIRKELVPDDFLLSDQRVPADFALDVALGYSF